RPVNDPPVAAPEDSKAAPASGPDAAGASPDLTLELRVKRRVSTTCRWRVDGDRLVVERPARASERELATMLATIRERATAYLRRQTVRTDAALLARARRLPARYFPERPVLRAARWSQRQINHTGRLYS